MDSVEGTGSSTAAIKNSNSRGVLEENINEKSSLLRNQVSRTIFGENDPESLRQRSENLISCVESHFPVCLSSRSDSASFFSRRKIVCKIVGVFLVLLVIVIAGVGCYFWFIR